MTDKELRRLSRGALLELLIEQIEENERLRSQLEVCQKQLSDKEILISESGSIAEAALKLNGVFQAAENAAKQYLENIQKYSGQQQEICKKIELKAQKEAERIVAEAQAYSEDLKAKADEYWHTAIGSAKLLNQ